MCKCRWSRLGWDNVDILNNTRGDKRQWPDCPLEQLCVLCGEGAARGPIGHHWSPSPHLDCHCERGLRGNEPHYIRGHQPPGAHVAGPETRDPALTIVNMLLVLVAALVAGAAGGGGVDTMRVCGAGD